MYLSILLIAALASCKKTSTTDLPVISTQEESSVESNNGSRDSTYFDTEKLREQQAKSQLLKKEGLLELQQSLPARPDLVISKNMVQEGDDYILDYTYPHLIEKQHPAATKFNNYMTQNHLDTERTINEILADNEMICDTLGTARHRDKRIINYKLYTAPDDVISVLLFKENYYSGMMHSSYMFDCVNYDLERQEFIDYDTFFIPGSEKMVFDLINEKITTQMNTGQVFYDCWQMTMNDFLRYKNNFIITEKELIFYLDDCIICPSHTGEYKVSLSSTALQHLINSNYKRLAL
jgi:hypothetical protein